MDLEQSRKFYERGRVEMDEGRLAEAIALFKESIHINPHFKTLELLGDCYRKENKMMESIAPLAAASALNRGVKSRSLLADSFLQLEEYANAEEVAKSVLTDSPDNRITLSVLEQINTQSGRREILTPAPHITGHTAP